MRNHPHFSPMGHSFCRAARGSWHHLKRGRQQHRRGKRVPGDGLLRFLGRSWAPLAHGHRPCSKEPAPLAEFLKSKVAVTTRSCAARMSCSRHTRPLDAGFEGGSFTSCYRRAIWHYIYRVYREYVTSCVYWSWRVPVRCGTGL